MKTPNDITGAIENIIHGNAIIFKRALKTKKILINHPDPVINARIVAIKLLDYDTLIVSCYLPATGSLDYKCSNNEQTENNNLKICLRKNVEYSSRVYMIEMVCISYRYFC